MDSPKKRTPKQERFIAEYLIDLNATQAAIRAGYSEKTAEVIACQNLIKLKGEIELAKASRIERLNLTADEMLLHLTAAVRAKISDIRNDDGTFKPVSQWPDIWQQMSNGGDVDVEDLMERSHDNVQAGESKSWDKVGTTTKIKYKFVDRGKLIELAMRHTQVNALALPKEEHQHVHLYFEERIARARQLLASDDSSRIIN